MLHKHNQCLVSLKEGRGAISKISKVFLFFTGSKYIYPGAKNTSEHRKPVFTSQNSEKQAYKAIKQ